jgi:hypothetical protein
MFAGRLRHVLTAILLALSIVGTAACSNMGPFPTQVPDEPGASRSGVDTAGEWAAGITENPGRRP